MTYGISMQAPVIWPTSPFKSMQEPTLGGCKADNENLRLMISKRVYSLDIFRPSHLAHHTCCLGANSPPISSGPLNTKDTMGPTGPVSG